MSQMVRQLDRGYSLIWRENRIEESVRGLGDDFEWVVPGFPGDEVRHGREGVLEFFRDWLEPWSDIEVEWTLEQAGADQVLAIIDMRGRGRESGVPTEMHFGQLWTFREGRAVRMVMYNDLEEARRAAGLS
jgi:ketosteroid isomerase-like protein